METTANNTGPSSLFVQQSEPQTHHHTFPVRTFKTFGCVQMGLGGVSAILSLVELTKNGAFMIVYSMPLLICSIWFIITGCLPLSMSLMKESNLKCQKISFMVCSIIGAAVFAPPMFSLAAIAGVFHLHEYPKNHMYIVSLSIVVLSLIEAVVAVISASYCCCCSPWETSSQQQTVLFVNDLHHGMNVITTETTQIPTNNIQQLVVTTEQRSIQNAMNHRAQQYQVVGVTQQRTGYPQNSNVFNTDPPPYKE